MKTTIPKITEEKKRIWYLLDAKGKILGKIATAIADILRGKHKVFFTPHMDLGDHVIVINADQFKVTGRKLESKQYYEHSGYPGHLRITPLQKLKKERLSKVFFEAVKGMLPKNKLRDRFLKKLHVVAGSEHSYGPQKPVILEL